MSQNLLVFKRSASSLQDRDMRHEKCSFIVLWVTDISPHWQNISEDSFTFTLIQLFYIIVSISEKCQNDLATSCMNNFKVKPPSDRLTITWLIFIFIFFICRTDPELLCTVSALKNKTNATGSTWDTKTE